jgi:DNA-directed RNA polymerase specialized sigma24 family protein
LPAEDGERTSAPVHEPRVIGQVSHDPAADVEEADLKQRVSELLSELPQIWRRSFLLHFVEGFDYTEIAQIQSLTEDQVRFNIQSAELFLHERLAESA